MTDPSPIIHLGLQKTASTFLQQKIFAASDRFHTPWGTRAGLAIEHFVMCHPARFDPEALRRDITAPDGKIPVISQEDLLGYPVHGLYYAEQTLRRIAEALPSARVLLCIREQRSILVSNYFQYVRQGGRFRIEDVLTGNANRIGFRPIFRLDHFEYDLTHALMARFFPPEQILILPYELLKHDRADFLARLSAFTGADLSPETDGGVVNERDGTTALRVRRVLNGLIPNPAERPQKYEDYPVMVRARNRAVRWMDKVSKSSGYDARLRAYVDSTVGDYYDASNAATSDLLGIDLKQLGYRVA